MPGGQLSLNTHVISTDAPLPVKLPVQNLQSHLLWTKYHLPEEPRRQDKVHATGLDALYNFDPLMKSTMPVDAQRHFRCHSRDTPNAERRPLATCGLRQSSSPKSHSVSRGTSGLTAFSLFTASQQPSQASRAISTHKD